MSLQRLPALALWVGGVSMLIVTTLELSAWYQPDASLLGLTGEDYSRWLIFPLMLILYGLAGLHRQQEKSYGRMGRLGFSTTFTGYSLLFVGESVSEVLFPLQHPVHTLGGFLSWLALPVIIAGLAIWGVASLRSRSLPMWAAPAPVAMASLVALVHLPLHDVFLNNLPYWLASGIVAQAINAVGFGLLGLALWLNPQISSTLMKPASHAARS